MSDNLNAWQQSIFGGSDDDDDDDDDDMVVRRSSSSSSTGNNNGHGNGLDATVTEIFGEDDDDIEVPLQSKKLGRAKSKSLGADREKEKERDRPIKKRRIGKSGRDGRSSSSGAGTGTGTGSGKRGRKVSNKAREAPQDRDRESGDEYDSGEEVTRTADDDAFIDDSGDDEGVLAEYAAEHQNFRDEAPDRHNRDKPQKKVKKASGASSSSTRSGGGKPAEDDVVAQAVAGMKKPKAAEVTEDAKRDFAENLTKQMSAAARADDQSSLRDQPALQKLQLLEAVQRACSVRDLQNALLKADILGRLREWIEPKSADALPSLQVRSAVYVILSSLPMMMDELKKSGVGQTVLALRKHKLETSANKQLLKELMERWCRMLFHKSVDMKASSAPRASEELQEAAARQSFAGSHLAAGESQPVEDAETGQEKETIPASRPTQSQSKSQQSTRSGGFDDIMDGSGAAKGKEKDKEPSRQELRQRVRTPHTLGFVFTVRPEQDNLKADPLKKIMKSSN